MNWLRLLRRAVGIPYLIIGALCVPPVIGLLKYGMYPEERTALYFQMACVTSGFMAILLGLESILIPAAGLSGERNSLIYNIVLSICLSMLLTKTGKQYGDVYLVDNIMGSTPDLWDPEAIVAFKAAYYFAHTAAVCFLAILAPLVLLLLINIKRTFTQQPEASTATPPPTPVASPKVSPPTKK